MESPETKNNQVMPASHHSPLTSVEAIGFWSIIFGLAIPPLGLVLAATAVYRAGQAAKKLALTLGVLGLVAVATGSAFYVWVYNEHKKTTVNSTYSYSSYDIYSLSGNGKGTGMSFSKPTNFTKQQSQYVTAMSASLTQQANVAAFGAPIIVGSIDANIAVPTVRIDKAYLSGLNKLFASGLSSQRYTSFRTGIINWLANNVVPGTVITLGNPSAFTDSGIKSNAWLFNYSATGKYPDGSPRNYNGALVFAVGKQNYYYLSVVSTANNWNANTSVWSKVFDSLKINQ